MSLLKVYNTTKEHLSNLSYFSISLIKSLLKEGGDAWEQNIFVEISLYDTRQTVQSEIINVDKTVFNIPNPEGVRITAINSPANNEEKKENKENNNKIMGLLKKDRYRWFNHLLISNLHS